MATRWMGLTRPSRTHVMHARRLPSRTVQTKTKRRRPLARGAAAMLHAIGDFSLLACATTLGLILFPDALTSPAYAQAFAAIDARIGFFSSEPVPGPASAPTIAPDEAEVHLLAATTWAEARSQGEEGMRAVAHVIVNRIGPRFGEDLETVVFRPKQFSAWNRGDPNRPLALNPELYASSGVNRETWETALSVAREVLAGESADPTEGSLFYHTRAVHPSWNRYGVGRRVIGAHVFYRDVLDRPA